MTTIQGIEGTVLPPSSDQLSTAATGLERSPSGGCRMRCRGSDAHNGPDTRNGPDLQNGPNAHDVLAIFAVPERIETPLSAAFTRLAAAVERLVSQMIRLIEARISQTPSSTSPSGSQPSTGAPGNGGQGGAAGSSPTGSASNSAGGSPSGASASTSGATTSPPANGEEEKGILPFQKRLLEIFSGHDRLSEVELRHGIVSYQLHQKSPNIERAYLAAYDVARKTGKGISDAVRDGLAAVEKQGLITGAEARWVFSLSSRAAQLDENLEYLRTTPGEGPNFDLRNALQIAEVSLASIQGGALKVPLLDWA